MDLLAEFRSLQRPDIEKGASTFNVVPILSSQHRIGKDGGGSPVLLIRTADEISASAGPVVLQHIAVQHDVLCHLVARDGAAREEVVSLVRCVSGEPTLREYFVRVVEMAVRQLGSTPSRGDVNKAIRRLTELFRAFEQPARQAVQGLWAELAAIMFADSPAALVSAWHRDPDEAFDFAVGPARVEVKSFQGQARIHSFSLRQVRPGTGVDVVIASLRAERSSGGASIADLIAGLARRGLGDDQLSKVDLVVAQCLGDSAGSALSLTFDLERARESLRFFDAASVPSVDPVLPAGVVSVRFESLLDEREALSPLDLRTRGTLFADVAPMG